MEELKLSENFKLSEFTKSDKADELQIYNLPDATAILYLQRLCVSILEPLYKSIDKKIKITSGFRCETLNRQVGGSAVSQHKYGQAADIKVDGLTSKQIFDKIVELNLPFYQVIDEFDSWVHVSISPDGKQNKKEKLKAVKKNGKTMYIDVK